MLCNTLHYENSWENHLKHVAFIFLFLLPVYQMLAMAVLDRILSIDRQNQWLVYICNSGYLRTLVESLRQDDAALQGLLAPQPPLLKPLYIYESKMVRKCSDTSVNPPCHGINMNT